MWADFLVFFIDNFHCEFTVIFLKFGIDMDVEIFDSSTAVQNLLLVKGIYIDDFHCESTVILLKFGMYM